MKVNDGMGDEEMIIWSFLSIVHFEVGIPKEVQHCRRCEISTISHCIEAFREGKVACRASGRI